MSFIIEISTEKEAISILQEKLGLDNIPKHLRTKNVCKIAVEKRWYDLEHVPQPLRTADLCIIAVSDDARALHYVPADMREDLILPLLRSGEVRIGDIEHDLQTPAMAASGFAAQEASPGVWDIWDIREDLVDHAVLTCVPDSKSDPQVLLQFAPDPDAPISGNEESDVYIVPVATWYDWMEEIEDEAFFATSWREAVEHLEHRGFRLYKGGCTGESTPDDYEDENGTTHTKIVIEVYPYSPRKHGTPRYRHVNT